MLTIAEAQAASGLSAHTLRYYERAGLLAVDRAHNGHRRFTDDDLQRLHFVQKLRRTGMPIRDVRAYFATDDPAARLELLEAHRARVVALLAEAAASLELVDFKIDLYREKL